MIRQASDTTINWNQKVFFVISISMLIKIIPAFVICFGNDEVYYLLYSKHLQWNYFDHPPMVSLMIRLFSLNLSLKAEGFIRLGSMACAAASTWIIYQLTSFIHSERAGFYAALLFSASFYTSLIAGFMVMPDSPQVLFWCATLYFFMKALQTPNLYSTWIIPGVFTGLCIMSKIHGVFLLGGLGLYVLAFDRQMLGLKGFWIYITITLLLASPIYLWNLNNDFITLKFHGERVKVDHFHINMIGFGREIIGEILYNNPINFFVIAGSIAAIWRNRSQNSSSKLLLLCISLPMIAVLLCLALFRDTLPHWSGPAYLTLIPLAAIFLDEHVNKKHAENKIRASVILLITSFILLFIVVEYFPGTLGSKKEINYGQGDITLDMYGWKEAGLKFAQIGKSRELLGKSQDPGILVNSKWFPAAHEDFYLCKATKKQMVGLGSLNDLHHYFWMNAMLPKDLDMESAYCIVPSNMPYSPLEEYKTFYSHADSITSFPVYRGGKISRYFKVYLLYGWKSKIPVWKAE